MLLQSSSYFKSQYSLRTKTDFITFQNEKKTHAPAFVTDFKKNYWHLRKEYFV